jgi:hypothetical protein
LAASGAALPPPMTPMISVLLLIVSPIFFIDTFAEIFNITESYSLSTFSDAQLDKMPAKPPCLFFVFAVVVTVPRVAFLKASSHEPFCP